MKIYCARDNQSNILDTVIGKPLWILCKFYRVGIAHETKNYYVRIFDKSINDKNHLTYYTVSTFPEATLYSEELFDYVIMFQSDSISPEDVQEFTGMISEFDFKPIIPTEIITQQELVEIAKSNLG